MRVEASIICISGSKQGVGLGSSDDVEEANGEGGADIVPDTETDGMTVKTEGVADVYRRAEADGGGVSVDSTVGRISISLLPYASGVIVYSAVMYSGDTKRYRDFNGELEGEGVGGGDFSTMTGSCDSSIEGSGTSSKDASGVVSRYIGFEVSGVLKSASDL